jgi:cell division septation protein DedD
VSDEGFREIQLNGKQLIFLFMAATVVSVVIFLFGVLVGRNARGGGEAAELAPTEITADRDVPAAFESVPSPSPAGAASPEASAAKSDEPPLTYAERLLREAPPPEKLKPSPAATTRDTPEPAPSVQEPVPVAPPAPRDAPATPPPAPAQAATTETPAPPSDPSGPGFAVQVAAYRDRRESDTLAKQLVAKGYPAFVLDPVKGAPTALFRVRVGKYKTLKDAQAIMARLQSAEQFNTAWIAR